MLRAIKTCGAFVLGALAATMAIRLIVDVDAQAAATAIHVCAAADGVLRAVQPPRACDPGQAALTFLIAGPQSPQPSASDTAALEQTLRDLERQAADLERAGSREGASTVKAPFDVRDRRGNLVFSVDSEPPYGTYVRRYGSGASAWLAAFDTGGYLRIDARGGNESVSIGRDVSGTDAFGLVMDEKGLGKGLRLGRGVGGTTAEMYKLIVYGPRRAASVGQSSVGSGLLFVADESGDIDSRVYVSSDGHGTIDVVNKAGTGVAAFKEGAHGGLLVLSSSSGEPMVDAGVHDGGYGLVRAGPAAFKLGLGSFGLPGSYILGKPQ